MTILRALKLAALVFSLVAGVPGSRIALAQSVEDEARAIAKGLQCPVCESVSVADSPSELAGQMRAIVRRKLEQGESREQILAYFVERYGDAVLAEPPKRGWLLVVWLVPTAAALVAALALCRWLARWRRATATEVIASPRISEAALSAAEAELSRLRAR
ncbi:MAG: cytochrome c-type biogenesis protein CcmH [Chloroflexota bacterium]